MVDWKLISDEELLGTPSVKLAKLLGVTRQAVSLERLRRRKRAAGEAFKAAGGFDNRLEADSAFRTEWARWRPTREPRVKKKLRAQDPVSRLLRELDDVREARGWSRTDLARKVGIDSGNLRALFGQSSERAQQRAGVAALKRLTDIVTALGCRIEIRALDISCAPPDASGKGSTA